MKPFRWFSNKILPLVYDDSLSYYEVLCKVVAKLNEVIAFVATIPTRMKELIADMVKKGDIKVVAKSIVSDITMKPWCNLRIMKNEADWLQGGCVISDNKVVYAFARNGGIKLALYNKGTNTIERERILPIAHGNSIAYSEEYKQLFITGVYDGEPNEKSVYVVDYDTFNIVSSFDVKSPYRDICGLEWFEGELFGWDYRSGSVGIISLDTFEFYPVFTADKEMGTLQTIAVTPDFYVVAFTNPNTIVLYRRSDYKIERIYNIGMFNGNNTIGELEFINFLNDRLFIGCCTTDSGSPLLFNAKVFETDLFTGAVNESWTLSTASLSNAIQMYCNCTKQIIDADGSATKPFYSIGQALDYALITYKSNAFTINLVSPGNYGRVTIGSSKVYINNTSGGVAEISGAYVQGGQVSFNNITFVDKMTDAFVVECDSSMVEFRSCTFAGADVSNAQLLLNTCDAYIGGTTFRDDIYPVRAMQGSKVIMGGEKPGRHIVKLEDSVGYSAQMSFSPFDIGNINCYTPAMPLVQWGHYSFGEITIPPDDYANMARRRWMYITYRCNGKYKSIVENIGLETTPIVITESYLQADGTVVNAVLEATITRTTNYCGFNITRNANNKGNQLNELSAPNGGSDYINIMQIGCVF